MAGRDSEGETNFWLFGYGSLIWKPPPHFDQRVPGYIRGYVRRFWQVRFFNPKLHTFSDYDRPGTTPSSPFDDAELTPASEDHRGTPEAPGRVVTLIHREFWETLNDLQRPSQNDQVWGVAYHIISSKVQEVKEYLDIREINGYSIQYTPFHPADKSKEDLHCLVYIGMPDNPQFLGALDPEDVAETINQSIGPSGENREYLLQLDDALRVLSDSSHDEHISDLARRVRSMPLPVRTRKQRRLSESGLQRISSTEEQEEIEKTP